MLMNTLDRYIGKSILGAIFATLFTLVGLSAIIKFVEQFRSVGRERFLRYLASGSLYRINHS